RGSERRLMPTVGLAGSDGWYDARNGDRLTDLQLTDFTCISELFAAQDESRNSLLAACANAADDETAILARQLDRLLDAENRSGSVLQVIVGTHVPPFQEAAWYEGKPSND